MKPWHELIGFQKENTVPDFYNATHIDSHTLGKGNNNYSELTLTYPVKYHYHATLIQLMMTVVKWRLYPDKRTRKLSYMIESLRLELRLMKENYPKIVTENYLQSLWEHAFEDAIRLISVELGIKNIFIPSYTPEDVFETTYELT